MTHAPGCSKPPPDSKRVSPGWFRLTCPDCGHVGSEAAKQQAIAPTLTPAPRPITSSGYVCRVHHDQPVTWRGTGCTRCAADLKRRKAPQPRDDYEEMETY